MPGEGALGWAFHYGIGTAYGLLLLVLSGEEWFRQPEASTPVLLSLALLVAPYFVMLPGLGLGIAGARTPKPYVTRLKSVAGHTAFGLGMYATAFVLKAWAGQLTSQGINGILH